MLSQLSIYDLHYNLHLLLIFTISLPVYQVFSVWTVNFPDKERNKCLDSGETNFSHRFTLITRTKRREFTHAVEVRTF